jgi:hypothetical protein
MIIPLQTLTKLRINLKKKLALTFLFALGTFAMVATIIRCVIALTDTTNSIAKIMIWSTLEETVAFLVANGPALRPLLLRSSDDSGNSASGFTAAHRTGTHHDLYELAPKDGAFVSVVSAGPNRVGGGGGGFVGGGMAGSKIAVLRTVEVSVDTEYAKKDFDGSSSHSSDWRP